jgi:hypothetical protein
MKHLRLSSVFIILVLMLACGGAPAPAPVVAPATQQPPAQQPPAQQPPTAVPAATKAPATTTGCDSARLVSEDPQDGGRVQAGNSFQKVWELLNTGTCTWDSKYQLIFVEGEQMAGLTQVQPLVKNLIPPGSSLSIFITMQAPDTAGEYTAKWKWVNGNGETIPVDIAGITSQFVTARITVP